MEFIKTSTKALVYQIGSVILILDYMTQIKIEGPDLSLKTEGDMVQNFQHLCLVA